MPDRATIPGITTDLHDPTDALAEGFGPDPTLFGPAPAPGDNVENFEQLYIAGLADDIAEHVPRRVASYNPTFGTAGISCAVARLEGWTWSHRYVIRHVLELMGGLTVEGLNDAGGRPLPACRDTANQIAAQLGNVAVGTVDNAISRAVLEGVLGRLSGSVRHIGAARRFYPGKPRGPRVLFPGPLLVGMLDEWAKATGDERAALTNQ